MGIGHQSPGPCVQGARESPRPPPCHRSPPVSAGCVSALPGRWLWEDRLVSTPRLAAIPAAPRTSALSGGGWGLAVGSSGRCEWPCSLPPGGPEDHTPRGQHPEELLQVAEERQHEGGQPPAAPRHRHPADQVAPARQGRTLREQPLSAREVFGMPRPGWAPTHPTQTAPVSPAHAQSRAASLGVPGPCPLSLRATRLSRVQEGPVLVHEPALRDPGPVARGRHVPATPQLQHQRGHGPAPGLHRGPRAWAQVRHRPAGGRQVAGPLCPSRPHPYPAGFPWSQCLHLGLSVPTPPVSQGLGGPGPGPCPLWASPWTEG